MATVRSTRLYVCYYRLWCAMPWLLVVGGQVQSSRLCFRDEGCCGRMGTVSFPVVKYGRGVLLTVHPLLVPWSWRSRAIPLPTLWATTRTVTGTLYLLGEHTHTHTHTHTHYISLVTFPESRKENKTL